MSAILDTSKILEEAVQSFQLRKPGILCIVTKQDGSTPGKIGFKAIVYTDSVTGTIGGGVTEARVIQKARALLHDGLQSPVILCFDLQGEPNSPEPTCGGTMEVYLEPLGSSPRVYIFGAGHVAYALAPLLAPAGFTISLIDDRPEFANSSRFPMAAELLTQPLQEALSELKSKIQSQDYILIMTRGHISDEEILAWAISTPARYIGMIGSARKAQIALEKLRAGNVPEDQISRITTPVGVEIGSQTPYEIGISITAQLIGVQRQEKSSE